MQEKAIEIESVEAGQTQLIHDNPLLSVWWV
jgi:hypothetical protein